MIPAYGASVKRQRKRRGNVFDEKKIALVTGASGGIGGACAELLAQEGYTVLVHGCHGIENAKTLADRLCAQGYDAHAVCCDLADSESAQRMCREILALYHHVDALALCAGVSPIPDFSVI